MSRVLLFLTPDFCNSNCGLWNNGFSITLNVFKIQPLRPLPRICILTNFLLACDLWQAVQEALRQVMGFCSGNSKAVFILSKQLWALYSELFGRNCIGWHNTSSGSTINLESMWSLMSIFLHNGMSTVSTYKMGCGEMKINAEVVLIFFWEAEGNRVYLISVWYTIPVKSIAM